jgi:hypothetical protein
MIYAINLSRLRNAEFIQFIKNFLAIVLANDPAALNVQLQYNNLLQMLAVLEGLFITEQGSIITEDVSAIDARRDKAITGFALLVNALGYHPDAATAKHAQLIDRQVKQYGGNIARQNYQAESAIIDNLLVDLAARPELAAAVTALNLVDWIKEMQQSNTAFNNTYLQRTDEIGAAPKDKIFAKRQEAGTLYQKLRDFIDSFYTINEGAEPYNKTANSLNALINQYNTMLAGRVGKDDENEQPPTPPTV